MKTIQQVKQWWNDGLITLTEAKQYSKECGFNMIRFEKASGGHSWVWMKR